VSTDGFVITNSHVVEKCQSINVHERGSAVIKGLDAKNDLALLKIQGKTAVAEFRATAPGLGGSVYALGFPYSGLLSSSVNFTGGNISSLSGIGNDSSVLQFTAPIQPGNSGGPLVDAEGLVVGVVTSRLADIEILKASGSLPQNVNFAIRGELAKAFLKANGVEPVIAQSKSPLPASEIAKKAQAYTVQIICSSID
jgi:serine protease Do